MAVQPRAAPGAPPVRNSGLLALAGGECWRWEPGNHEMKRIFRPKLAFTIFYFLFGLAISLCFAALLATVVFSEPSLALKILVFTLFSGLSLFGVWILLSPLAMKFVLDEAGIEYHTLNYIIRASWSEISRTVLDNGAIILVLPDSSQIQPQPWLKMMWPLVAKERIQTIPIGFYALIFGKGFADAVFQLAPHLIK